MIEPLREREAVAAEPIFNVCGAGDVVSLVLIRAEIIPLTLPGVPGTLTSPLSEGLSLACVDSLEGTCEPSCRQSLTVR